MRRIIVFALIISAATTIYAAQEAAGQTFSRQNDLRPRCFEGFEIIGFAENDNDEALKNYLSKNSITWPIVSKDNDHYEAVVLSYAIKNIPASFWPFFFMGSK